METWSVRYAEGVEPRGRVVAVFHVKELNLASLGRFGRSFLGAEFSLRGADGTGTWTVAEYYVARIERGQTVAGGSTFLSFVRTSPGRYSGRPGLVHVQDSEG